MAISDSELDRQLKIYVNATNQATKDAVIRKITSEEPEDDYEKPKPKPKTVPKTSSSSGSDSFSTGFADQSKLEALKKITAAGASLSRTDPTKTSTSGNSRGVPRFFSPMPYEGPNPYDTGATGPLRRNAIENNPALAADVQARRWLLGKLKSDPNFMSKIPEYKPSGWKPPTKRLALGVKASPNSGLKIAIQNDKAQTDKLAQDLKETYGFTLFDLARIAASGYSKDDVVKLNEVGTTDTKVVKAVIDKIIESKNISNSGGMNVPSNYVPPAPSDSIAGRGGMNFPPASSGGDSYAGNVVPDIPEVLARGYQGVTQSDGSVIPGYPNITPPTSIQQRADALRSRERNPNPVSKLQRDELRGIPGGQDFGPADSGLGFTDFAQDYSQIFFDAEGKPTMTDAKGNPISIDAARDYYAFITDYGVQTAVGNLLDPSNPYFKSVNVINSRSDQNPAISRAWEWAQDAMKNGEIGAIEFRKIVDGLSAEYPEIPIIPSNYVPGAGSSGGGGGSGGSGGSGWSGYSGGGGGGGGGRSSGGGGSSSGGTSAGGDLEWTEYPGPVTDYPMPDWWTPTVPGDVNNPEGMYFGAANVLLPFLSPEDQRKVATMLFNEDPETFAAYDPDTLQLLGPDDVTTEMKQQYYGATRAEGVIGALDSIVSNIDVEDADEDAKKGHDFLKNLAALMRQFFKNNDNISRQDYMEFMNAVDPLLQAAQSDDVLSPYYTLGRMLVKPFFTAGELYPYQRVGNDIVFGEPNDELLY